MDARGLRLFVTSVMAKEAAVRSLAIDAALRDGMTLEVALCVITNLAYVRATLGMATEAVVTELRGKT